MSQTDIYSVVSTTADTALFGQALNLADLAGVFNDSSLDITVFAPSNTALLGALAQLGLSQDALMTNAVKMAPILRYHTIEPATNAATLIAGGFKSWNAGLAPFLGSAGLAVNGTSSPIKVISAGTDANIVTSNIEAGDSIVHIIDSVLLPFYPSAAVAIARNSLTSTLAGLASTYAPSILTLLNPLAEFTVFAPINSAFTTALSNNSAILQYLKSTPIGALYLLNYHIVPKPVIFSPSSLTGTTTVTTLSGHKLTIVKSGGNTVVVFPTGNATITKSYSVGFNSDGTQRAAVHQLSQVLLPPSTTTLADALAAKTDASTLIAALNSSSIYAGVLGASSNFQGTVLVPVDAAWSAYFSNNIFGAAVLLASQNGLKQLLDLHTIPGVALSVSSIANTSTNLTTNAGANTLSVIKAANGSVTFTALSTGTVATAVGSEFYVGTVGNTTTVIFIDAVLVPANFNLFGAASHAGPSPFAMLLCSLFAAALLHAFGRQ